MECIFCHRQATTESLAPITRERIACMIATWFAVEAPTSVRGQEAIS
jgi:hypothetical protein